MNPIALKSLTALGLLAASLALAGPAAAAPQKPEAPAAPELMTIAKPDTIREMARGYGTSRITKDSLGDPMIKGKANGLNYYVFFYDCEKGENCTSVQFQAGFDLGKKADIGRINEWNVKKRFAKAEANDKGHALVRMDYSFIGGAPREHLDNVMSLWVMLLKEYADHIGFKH